MSKYTERSIGELEQIVANAPKDAEAWETLAQKYHDEYYGDNYAEKSVFAATRAILLGRDTAENRYRRAYHILVNNVMDSKEAVPDLQRAIALDPRNTSYIEMLADHYVSQSEFDKAQELYTQMLKIEPSNSWALTMRSKINADRGNFSAALQDAQKNIDLYPEVGMSYVYLGHIYVAMNNYEQAKMAYKTALQRSNPCAPANEVLARIAIDEGKFAEGLPHCEELLRIEEAHIRSYGEQNRKPDTYYLRAIIYAGMGRRDKAKEDFKTCLSIDPNYEDAEKQLNALSFAPLQSIGTVLGKIIKVFFSFMFKAVLKGWSEAIDNEKRRGRY